MAKLLLVSTGGTIAMKTVGSISAGVTPVLTGEDLVSSVPDIHKYCDVEIVNYSNKPGSWLNWADILNISNLLNHQFTYREIVGAIVIQGTDTIEETAFAFDLLVNSDKPVVVTGAMRGATMLSADGPANLRDAVITASSPLMRGQGSLVVLNGEIHAARHVIKNHTVQLNAFISVAPGIIGAVTEGHVLPCYAVKRTLSVKLNAGACIPEVMLAKAALSDSARMVKMALKSGYYGVVLEAMGAGHLPEHYVRTISDISKKIPVVLSTRVPAGSVLTCTYGFKGAEIDLLKRGVFYSGRLGSLRSRILLSLLLAKYQDLKTIKLEFEKRVF